MSIELHSLMRVTVKERPGTFVVIGMNHTVNTCAILCDKTNEFITVAIGNIDKVIDQDIRVPKLPMSVVIEHLQDVRFDPSCEDIYATMCDAMIENTRVKDFFQSMIDKIDYDGAISILQGDQS